MKFTPGDGYNTLDCWEVADRDVIGVANEYGDITAYVQRADGTRGHSFGGPVYDPPEFLNVCQRDTVFSIEPDWCTHEWDMTDAERRVAGALAARVGWLDVARVGV